MLKDRKLLKIKFLSGEQAIPNKKWMGSQGCLLFNSDEILIIDGNEWPRCQEQLGAFRGEP